MPRFSDRTIYRLLEAVPATLVWTTFVLAIALSFWQPIFVIYFVILFDLYWLLRVCYFVLYISLSWRRYQGAIRRDWWTDLQTLPRWRDMYHLIFLPTYKEDIGVLRSTLLRLKETVYDTKRYIVVLAGEERDKEQFLANAETLAQEFAGVFADIVTTVHPKNLPDEIPGKGSNLNWAGHRLQEYIDAKGIPYRDIIVSSFDIDTMVHPQYFACLTHTYLTHPNPERSSYQPAVLYDNNLWESPAIVRIAAFGTTFWLMTELARPERLFTFSSHSMSWQALVDVGFWEKQIVTEDSRIFIQCFLRYNGDYEVTPLYVPVSMDMVQAESYAQSLVALYKQQRRWAWGVEHFPYMVWNFAKRPLIPFRKKVRYVWNLIEGMYSWATVPILIFILGRLPMLVAAPAVQQQALLQNAPFVLETLLRLSMVGIFVSATLSLWLLPPRPQGMRSHVYFTMLAQWFLLPVTLVIFGSFAAIDAQTRLMLGKYLGFNVTKKIRRPV